MAPFCRLISGKFLAHLRACGPRSGAWLFCLGLQAAIAAPARADCHTAAPLASCVNANALWIPTGDARFFSMGRPVATQRGHISLAFGLQVLLEPLRVEVPSPNDTGRELALVDFALDQDLSLALGLGAKFELGLSLPVILRQRGTGADGLSSQRGKPLEASAERDPRIGIARAVPIFGTLRAKPRAELALPLGDAHAFASDGAVTVAPGVVLEWTLGPVSIGADLALRLRPSATLASGRWGSQALLALGVSYDVFEPALLSIGIEAWVAPSLIDSTSDQGRETGLETRYLPAEWLLSLRSHPNPFSSPWSIAFGAGGGLALSRDTWGSDTVHFLAPTSPTLRALVEVRYAPTD